MFWLLASVSATLSATVVVALVYLYLYVQDRLRHTGIWALSWSLLALHYALSLPLEELANTPVLFLEHMAALSGGVLLLWGVHDLVGRPFSPWWWVGLGAGAAWGLVAVVAGLEPIAFTLPTYVLLGALHVLTGALILRYEPSRGGGRAVAGWAFVLWGVHKLDYPFLRPMEVAAPWGYLAAALLALVSAIGVLLIHFERTKEGLAASEERFRMLVDHASDLVWRRRLHPEPAFEYVSPSAANLIGYTPEDHYRDRDLWSRIADPDDLVRLSGRGSGSDADQEPQLLRWRRKDGATIWVEQRSVPIVDESGELVAVQGIARDVTERVAAEEALSESERRYSSLFHDSHAVMLLVDPETGCIVDANRAASEYFRYPHGQLLRVRINTLNQLSDEEMERIMREALDGQLDRFEYRARLASGEERDAEAYVGPVVVGGRQLFYSIVHDITERRRAEEELLETRDTLEAVLTASPVPVVALDPEGRVTLWNPAAHQVFGWPPEEALGRTMPSVPEDLREDYRSLLNRVLDGEVLTGVERRWRRKDGRPVTVSMTGAPLRDAEGGAIGAMAILADVTEHRLLEAQLRQAQKMEAVGRLAGGIAHDFNNLLTVINGASEMLMTTLPPDHPLREEIEEIRAAGGRAAQLTRQLLAFSRRQVLEVRVVSLNDVLEGMIRMLQRIIGEDVELRLHIQPDTVAVRADPAQIEQVIVNLVVNARDAMPEGGVLTLETTNVTVGPEGLEGRPDVEGGEYACLSVSDTGVGMTPEVRERIFEPFFTTKPIGGGTGLGLATVFGIVRQFGGWINVQSEPGVGTRFAICLPRSEASAPQGGAASREEIRGTETVLVVEDQGQVRTATRRMLEQLGYRVLAAPDGEGALEIMEREGAAIDLAITDIVMPGMDGTELARRLRARYPSLGILYISGYTSPPVGVRISLDPSVPLLYKPFTLRSLGRMVRRILDGRASEAAT